MRRIATIVGARPQFIKAAVVSRLLQAIPGMQEVLVHTGQHYDHNMSRVFFQELEIPEPDYHLGIGSGSHGAQTGRILGAVEAVLLKEKPNIVLVYGDTNTTLAGALAAAKLHIPVAHVEAGLRSFNRRMPEEINRVVTDHVSDLLFAPTEAAVANLQREGVPEERIYLVGDVMYDAALYYGRRAEQNSRILEWLDLRPRGYVLATVHRAENTDDPQRLKAIIGGLLQVSREVPVILPVHPRTRKAIEARGLLHESRGNLRIIPPVGYLDMIMLERHARLIATDSGGVQKEAFFYRVPCVTLRGETEWVELLELRWNHLVPPTDPQTVRDGIMARIDVRGEEAELYGGGRAASRIVRILQEAVRV